MFTYLRSNETERWTESVFCRVTHQMLTVAKILGQNLGHHVNVGDPITDVWLLPPQGYVSRKLGLGVDRGLKHRLKWNAGSPRPQHL